MYVSVGERALLEQKIVTLEQRLVLVERFVEMRFCETFRDFSVRRLPTSSPLLSAARDTCGKIPQVDTARVDDQENANNESSGEGPPGSQEYSPPSSPLPPPAQIGEEDDNEEGNPSVTTYRTRSGRKTKRLTATALGGGARSGTRGDDKPPRTSAGPTPRKILKVTVTRVDTKSFKKSKIDDEASEEETGANLANVNVKLDCDQQDDTYLEFPPESPDGEAGRDSDAPDNDGHDDQDWNAPSGEEETDDDDDFSLEKDSGDPTSKKTPTTSQKTTVKRRRKDRYTPSRLDLIPEGVSLQPLNPEGLKECPICHKHWKLDAYEYHMQSHVKERNFHCKFCDQRFFNRQQRNQHERLHQVEKYGRKCRLCEKVFVNSWKVLYHERACIRRRLEADEHVDPVIIQDVRERSKNVDLNWPDPNEKVPEGMKKCKHCKRYIAEDLFMEHLKKLHASWKCTLCEMTFVLKTGLIRHMCRTHGKNRVTCDRCKKTFESRAKIRNHNAKCKEEHAKKMRKGWVEGKLPNEENNKDNDREEEEAVPEENQEEMGNKSQEEICMEVEVETSQTENATGAK